MGGALLESPMMTAMHGKFRVSSVLPVELNCLQYLFFRLWLNDNAMFYKQTLTEKK